MLFDSTAFDSWGGCVMESVFESSRFMGVRATHCGMTVGVVLALLGQLAVAQPTLSLREVHLRGYVHESSGNGVTCASPELLSYFPDGTRLIRRHEGRTAPDEAGVYVEQAEARYYRESANGDRRLLFAIKSRRTVGAEDEYGGWSPPGLGPLSPGGDWFLGQRQRRWREADVPKSADQAVVYNWRTGEVIPLPETADAQAWVDDDRVVCVDKGDADPLTGSPRTLLVWDLKSISVAQEIPLPGQLGAVRFVSPGRLAVCVQPDPSPEWPENEAFWRERCLDYLGARSQLAVAMGLDMVRAELARRQKHELNARMAAATAAARPVPGAEAWETGAGLGAFETDPLQVPDQDQAYGPVYLLDLTDPPAVRWELLLARVPLALPPISPDGRFSAFTVPRPGYAPGQPPLVIYDLRTHRWVRVPQIRGQVQCWLPSGEAVLANAIKPESPVGSMDPADWSWFEVDVRPVLAELLGASAPPDADDGK